MCEELIERFRRWADPRAVKGLRKAFAHYDEKDVKRALLAAIELFRWLASETARKMNCLYPAEAANQATKWIRTCISQDMPT
jgi:aminoglycoside 6-adenylyltransferase